MELATESVNNDFYAFFPFGSHIAGVSIDFMLEMKWHTSALGKRGAVSLRRAELLRGGLRSTAGSTPEEMPNLRRALTEPRKPQKRAHGFKAPYNILHLASKFTARTC